MRALGPVLALLVGCAAAKGAGREVEAPSVRGEREADRHEAVPTTAGPLVLAAPADHPELEATNGFVEVGAEERAASADLSRIAPLVLDAPPFRHTVVDAIPFAEASRPPRLTRISEVPNEITDMAAWYERNGLASLAFGAADAPAFAPLEYGGAALSLGIAHRDHSVLVFANRFLAVLDGSRRLVALFDFERYMRGPNDRPRDRMFTEQGIGWAEVREGVLYVSHGHHTYAKSSGGMNAYLTALDLATGRLRWRSAPLVASAHGFLLGGNYVVAGYGFTAEPDYLYVLDRSTGAVVSRTAVRSAPEILIEKAGRLYVRTYDTDYVFELR